jgi:hypothetical protein
MSSVLTNCLCAIIDGMDQAKFKLPRLPEKRFSKLLERLKRPRLHVAAVWLHGLMMQIWVADEDLKKDSVTQIEMLTRSLSSALERLGVLPLGFHLQQDNTYREGKNQYSCAFLLLLVVLGIFRWASTGFLRVGHSNFQ